MSLKNSQAVEETLGANASKDQSLARMINYSSHGGLSEVDSKKSTAFECSIEEKTCANSCKIPRPLLMASNSFNATLKNNQSEGKTKKPPSMIPRSRSRKRNESDKVIFGIPPKNESVINQIDDMGVSNNMEVHGDFADRKSGVVLPAYETPSKPFVLESNNLEEKLIKVSSLSLKSCQDFIEVTKDTPYEDIQEQIPPSVLSNKKISKREQEFDVPTRSVKTAENKDNEVQAARQERTIRHLYDTLKCTFGPLFDRINRENMTNGETERTHSHSAAEKAVHNYEPVPDLLSVQGNYEFTLKEISNIWRNTISLIGSVRDHAVKFVEGDNKLIDKEQLALEAEMLQLALDFAVSYSKVKTDFLIQLIRKRLKVKSAEKTELENFMDSKTFAALYNNDDLAAMARTVQDLNASLLTGEDQEFE